MVATAYRETSADAADESGRPRKTLRAAAGWLILCLLVFLWWASGYRSLVQLLGEWQFRHLGRYYPSITVSVAVIILMLPAAVISAWAHWRRRRRLKAMSAGVLDPFVRLALATRSAKRTRFFFAGLSIVTALVAVAVFVSMLWLPQDSGPIRTVTGVEGSVQPEGAAAYAPPFSVGRVAKIEENVGLARRVIYTAPVHLSGQKEGDSFLTTVDPSSTRPLRFKPITSGVLVERGLPRELVNLYRAAGVPVSDRSYLLMRDGATVRWRSIVLGIQVALLSLVALVVALLMGRQVRRLRRIATEHGAPPTR